MREVGEKYEKMVISLGEGREDGRGRTEVREEGKERDSRERVGKGERREE